MQFPVVLRYTPTKWAEAQCNRSGNSPSKFVTLSYQNKEIDSASPSPTRNASAVPSAQPLYAVAPTARKRYLQSLSAESFEKPVDESLRDMSNYEKNAASKPLSVLEAEWYLDVTNVAQRLKLLRETYKVIKSVRKKKMMGEKADFQSLFDLRLSGNLSPHQIDDDRHAQLRSEDDDDPYTPVHRPPPIPNRRGRPRKKRGVDRKQTMSRSEHKRTRASLRRNVTPDVPSSPAEKILPTSEPPEPSSDARYGKLEKEDSSLSSQNERSATPRSPHPKPSSQVTVANNLPNPYKQKNNSAVPSSSPIPNVLSGGVSNEGGATQYLHPDSFAVYANEDRNLIKKISQSFQEDTKHGLPASRYSSQPNVPLSIPVSEPLQVRTIGPNSFIDSANGRVPLANNEDNRGEGNRATTSSSTSELLNDIYSRTEHASAGASSHGNVTDATNVGLDDHVKGYSELLRGIDTHFLGEAATPQEVPLSNHNPQTRGASMGYAVQLPNIQSVQSNTSVLFPKSKDSHTHPPA